MSQMVLEHEHCFKKNELQEIDVGRPAARHRTGTRPAGSAAGGGAGCVGVGARAVQGGVAGPGQPAQVQHEAAAARRERIVI